MVRWFIIVGILLAILVGGLVGFNALRMQNPKSCPT
jgi:multidrug efflux system membrane fusion protein